MGDITEPGGKYLLELPGFYWKAKQFTSFSSKLLKWKFCEVCKEHGRIYEKIYCPHYYYFKAYKIPVVIYSMNFFSCFIGRV